MRRVFGVLFIAVICFAFGVSLSKILAHGGGLDACGGHNDKKHGGYHVHNWTAFCGCHPDAAECASRKSDATPTPSGTGTPLVSTSAGVGSITDLRTRVQKLETRVEALERAIAIR